MCISAVNFYNNIYTYVGGENLNTYTCVLFTYIGVYIVL